MTFQHARGKDLPGRAPSRRQHQGDAERMLPRIIGMVVTLVIDDEARTTQTGKLLRHTWTDRAWCVNDRVFALHEIDAFHCAWIDAEHNCTMTTIVVDEVTA